jgi:hypothetical protein
MSQVTETLVLLWDHEDPELLADGLALHFKNHDRWYWKDVADEGLRVYDMLLGANSARSPALNSLMTSVAASAAKGVFAAIAAAIGVQSPALECAVSRWYDGQDDASPPIGLERLRQILPSSTEPSWEHVVLGRLHHETIVHGFHEAAYQVLEAPKPHIEGLDPAEITLSDMGWTWRQALEESEDSEFQVALNSAGEAIARAGYRVTGRGFTGSYQWLSFDSAVAVHEPLDVYEERGQI